ncbi:MAG: hypothetical protein L3J14_00020 [Flavobacteriaceae bacterium]|nr:hypothetical protein [Flavobacteriaceae bacterium]
MKKIILTLTFGLFFIAVTNAQGATETKKEVTEASISENAESTDTKTTCCAGKSKEACKGKSKAECKGESKAKCKGKAKADCKSKSKAECKGKAIKEDKTL